VQLRADSAARWDRGGPPPAVTKPSVGAEIILFRPLKRAGGCFDIPAIPVSRLGLPNAARRRGLKAIRCLL